MSIKNCLPLMGGGDGRIKVEMDAMMRLTAGYCGG
jgi:hypothetical protein